MFCCRPSLDHSVPTANLASIRPAICWGRWHEGPGPPLNSHDEWRFRNSYFSHLFIHFTYSLEVQRLYFECLFHQRLLF